MVGVGRLNKSKWFHVARAFPDQIEASATYKTTLVAVGRGTGRSFHALGDYTAVPTGFYIHGAGLKDKTQFV